MRSAVIFLCLSIAFGILFLIFRQIVIDEEMQEVLQWHNGFLQEMVKQHLQSSDKQD